MSGSRFLNQFRDQIRALLTWPNPPRRRSPRRRVIEQLESRQLLSSSPVIQQIRGPYYGEAKETCTFDVSFSEAVTGVDVTDFDVLAGAGLRVGRIDVTGAGQYWTVTASDFTGAGQLDIVLRANTDIRDADGNAVFSPVNSYLLEQQEPDGAFLQINSVAAGDFDGDGTEELAVRHNGGVSLIRVQAGEIQQQLQFTSSDLEIFGAADLTGDGRDELISLQYDRFIVHSFNETGKLVPIFTRTFGNVSGSPSWFRAALDPEKGIGDFNGDGHPDQIVSFSTQSFDRDRIQLMVGDGTGRFVDGQVIETPSGIYAAAHRGDFNADGRPDLLLETFTSNNDEFVVSTHVYHGQPGGNLAYQRSYNGRRIHRLADMNGDGRVDIVGVESGATAGLAVFLGAADGTFGSGPIVPATSRPRDLVIQDVDSDGLPDLVLANETPEGCELSFYRQVANGSERSFSLQSTRAVPHGGSPAPGVLQLVSLGSGGSQLELRCSSASWVESVASRVVQITIGSGPDYEIRTDMILSLNNSFFSPVSHLRTVFDADLNGDGVPDTVLLSPPRGRSDYYGVSDLRVLMRNPTGVGAGRIAKEFLIAEDEGNDAFFIAAGSLDADGIPDVVTVSPSVNRVNVKKGLGDGRFAASRSFAVGGGAGAPFIDDFNGDGRRDIGVVNSADNSISLLLGQPSGDFLRVDSDTTVKPIASAAADADGDGQTDLLLLTGTGELGLLPGRGDGTFGSLITFETGLQATLMEVGDLNSDGRPDVVLASPSDSKLVVMLGAATGYSISANLAVEEGTRAICLGDWNSDGHPDLIVAGISSDNLKAWQGSAGGGLSSPLYVGQFDGSAAAYLDLQFADFNGGGPELLVIEQHFSGYRRQYLIENLSGAIRFGDVVARGYRPRAFATADFSGDGRTDIVFIDSIRDSVRLLKNRGRFGGQYRTWITENLSPGMDPINSVTIPEDTTEYRLQVTGITSGDGIQQPVRVVASSGSDLLPNPVFVPGTVPGTGELVLKPTRARSGVVTVTVVVEDAGPDLAYEKMSDNRKEVRFFTLTITPTRTVITQPIGVITDQRPLIEWSDLPEAKTWKIFIANATTGKSPLFLDTVIGRSYRPLLDVGIGLVDIWIHGIRADGTGMPWSLRHRIEVRTATTVAPMAARQATLRPTAEFSAVPGANAVEIYLSNLSNPQAPPLREIVNTSSWTPSSDLGLMRYRLYARALVRDKFAANWSQPRDFVVAAAPNQTAPLQISIEQRPTFSWTAIPGATNYWLQLRHILTGKVLADVRDIATTSWQPATPLSFGAYRWWVLAENKTASLRSDWSRAVDFTIGDRPALTAPSGNLNNTTVVVRWLPFPQAVSYQLWISQTTPSLQQVFYRAGITGTSHEVAGVLKRGTPYRVWVRAVLSSSAATYWSQSVDFTIV